MRIVSLLPSATEIICGLGLGDSLVGVSHECDYPAEVSDVPKVTRTRISNDATSGEIDQLVRDHLKADRALYSLDMETFQSVRPDLIVTQTLCEVCAVPEREVQAAACSLPGNPQILNLEPSRLADVFESIRKVGQATQREREAGDYVASLKARVEAVIRRSRSIDKRPSVILLEWIDPPFCAGHWSPQLIEYAGGREAIGLAGQKSVCTPWQKIAVSDPEVMVIACCGFNVERTWRDLPILQSYPGWKQLRCVRDRRVYVIDGSAYFNRPGPRLVDSLEILANALHPEAHPLPTGLPPAIPITS